MTGSSALPRTQGRRSRWLGLAVLASVTALAACDRLPFGLGSSPENKSACAAATKPNPALDAPLDRYGLDQWLFDAAVRREVNVERCDRGLAPLAEDVALARAAAYHSGDLVVEDCFDHNSPVEGRATPADRLTQTGVRFTRLAENIATLSLYDLEGRHFIVRDAANCDFTFTQGGPKILPHSYASAAKSLVASWMDSSGHRKNILNADMTRIGTGAAVKPNPDICGELIVTQDFAG